MQKDNMLSPIGTPPRRRFDGRIPTTSFLTPKKDTSFLSSTRLSPLKLSPRYSLSETTSPRLQNNSRREQVSYRSGPLLASTRFNVNLGTYTDVKSPGLASRIVQYNNEQQKEMIHTHQPKYGSPGLFPVVHFFKKDLPVITPKQQRVTVKLASPDVSLYYGTIETITSVNDETQSSSRRDPTQPDISTRSVLDALKEISRKRINGAEEYNNSSDGKKSKRLNEYSLNEFSKKRNREESPPKDVSNPPIKQSTKRMCIIDPIYASSTSSLFYMERGMKRKVLPSEENNKGEQTENKQIKLTNAETQTIEAPSPKPVTVIKEKKPEKEPIAKEKEPNLNETYFIPAVSVFSEKLHEIQKKNKLAKVLSVITGEKPVLIPLDIGTIDDPKPAPVSILSPQNKAKHDKHVHFNLENNKVTDKVETSKPTDVEINVETTTNSTAVSIIATTIQNIVTTLAPATTTTISEIVTNNATVTTQTKSTPVVGGFKFDVTPPKSISQPSSPNTSNQTPMFNLGNNFNTPEKSLKPLSFGTPQKSYSGLLFGADSKPIAGSTVLSNTFTVSSPNKSPTRTQAIPLVTTTAIGSTTTFGSNTITSSAVSKAPEGNMFKSSIALPLPTSTVTNSLGFVADNKSSTSTTTINNASSSMFGNATTVPTFGNNGVNTSSAFGNNGGSTTATPAFENIVKTTTLSFPSNGANTITTPAFGSNGGNTTTPAFGNFANAAKSSSITMTQNTSTFGNSTTITNTVSGFGSSGFGTSAPIFGTNTTTTLSFGAPVSSASIFGAAGAKSTTASSTIFGSSTGGFSTTSISPSFGGANNKTSTTETPGFDGNKSTPAFGSNTGGFGTVSAPAAFGGSNASGFGVANTTASTFGTSTTNAGFGSTSSTGGFAAGKSTSGFGTTGFGVVSSTSGFGGSAATTNPGFGTSATANSGFGAPVATTNSGFGAPTTTTSVFGVSTNSGFGPTTTATPMFGGATSTSSGFGTTSNAAFGAPTTTSTTFAANKGGFSFGNATAGFGGPTTTNSSFGGTSTTSANTAPTFGTLTTKAAFGSTTTPSFGTSNMFGSSTTTTAFNFGGSNVTTTTASPFGVTPNSSAFGTTNAAPAFGANTTSSFATPMTIQSTFGTSQPPAFGNAVNPTFGAKTTESMFGTTNTPAFGTAGSAPAFGTTNTASTFGTSNNNAFGSTTPAFGSGASGNANTFGNANPGFGPSGSGDFKTQNTAFGSASNTTAPFGTTGQTNFNSFGANVNNANQQGGVFAFGSANTTSAAGTATAPNTKPSGVFSFGNNEVPKPAGTFNFSGNATSNFGSPTPNFGTTNFGNTSTPGFNYQFSSANTRMFNIGTGSSSVKSRNPLKNKRH